jgi:hypothetical protein
MYILVQDQADDLHLIHELLYHIMVLICELNKPRWFQILQDSREVVGRFEEVFGTPGRPSDFRPHIWVRKAE